MARSTAASRSLGPLTGLRVIEISSFVAAPLGGMTLAQLGADVIRVDPRGGAADIGRWPIAASGTSLYWTGLNKGKRSLEVDLRSPQGQELVRRLVAGAPRRSAVVLTNAVGQPWLTYSGLRPLCEDLIHVHVQGNHDGSPAVDYTVNAEIGFPLVTGPRGHTDPINHVLPAWDIACGLFASLGVASAARERELTGAGRALTVALADVALAMAGNLGFLAEAQINRVNRPRIGNYLYGGFARDFASADGRRFMVVVLSSRHWRDFVTITDLGVPITALEGALNCDFSREDDRFAHREVIAALASSWFAVRPAAEVEHALRGTALLWAQYSSFAELVSRAQVDPRLHPILSLLNQPGVGPHLAPGLPMSFDGAIESPQPAPSLGADTHEILATELGLTAQQRADLANAGVIPTVDASIDSAPLR